MLVEIEYEGLTGYGEASMPPYLGETTETASSFFSKIDLQEFRLPDDFEAILDYVDAISVGNTAAKAAIDIALHDLCGKILNASCRKILGIGESNPKFTSFTIGIDTPEMIVTKVSEAKEFKILKVKLGSDSDKEIINTIRSVTDKPVYADINQGWKNKDFALEMAFWLAERGVQLLEQPMSKFNLDDHAWLSERSPIPIIADEACQRFADMQTVKNSYTGINIKLMKSTGIREAFKMMQYAHAHNLKVMLGCMTETSCAISAASQLAELADWVDLDGALLITNDLFSGTKIVDGAVVLNNLPGIGVTKNS